MATYNTNLIEALIILLSIQNKNKKHFDADGLKMLLTTIKYKCGKTYDQHSVLPEPHSFKTLEATHLFYKVVVMCLCNVIYVGKKPVCSHPLYSPEPISVLECNGSLHSPHKSD